MGKQDQDSFSMASASSRPSVDQGRKTARWFSLRRMFRDIQRQRYASSSQKKRSLQIELDFRSASSRHSSPQYDRDVAIHSIEVISKDSTGSAHGSTGKGESSNAGRIDCPLCALQQPRENFPHIITCSHRACRDCLKQYLRIEITESRVNIACPECTEKLHPNDIQKILEDDVLIRKYEEFMLRRVLVLDPDARWCPAPDCGYVVIATGCASCPKLMCERPGCGTLFCYHCKQYWHPNQTCDAARAERSSNLRSSSFSYSHDSSSHNEIKPCPRCGAFIVKMDDGSCNHMTCAMCGAEFCWLCMKEISDLHYLSPSGCTFWGKKPWSRKKKILWQLGTLVGAPVGISLIAGVAVPAIIIGVPIWVGRKLHAKCGGMSVHKRNLAVAGGVIGSILVSPLLAAVAVGIGVPILLAYVYGVVPVSLCRSGGCGVSTTNTGGVRIDFDENEAPVIGNTGPYAALDARSVVETIDGHHLINPSIGPSIGEMSVGMTNSLSASGSHMERVGGVIREDSCDRDSSSHQAMAGSCINESLSGSLIAGHTSLQNRLEVQAEVSTSVAPLQNKRGSLSSESANLSIDTKSGTISFGDNISTKALAGSLCVRDRDNNSATVSLSETPIESTNNQVITATAASDACSGESGFLPRACIHRYGSPPASRSVSFVRDLKTSDMSSTNHDAGCRAKTYKRQSMSVGDSIDERVETNFDYLSVHSLAEEPGLECCTGGSDIVAMVAAAPNAPICCVHNRLQMTRGSVDALTNSALCPTTGLTDVENCHPRKCMHTALRIHSSTSSESTSIEIISCSNEAPSLQSAAEMKSSLVDMCSVAEEKGTGGSSCSSDTSSGCGSVSIPLFVHDS